MILKNEQLCYKQIEALEEILKRIQFRLIDLEGCNLDEDVSNWIKKLPLKLSYFLKFHFSILKQGATALFEMIEYYESATHLDLSNNTNLGIRAYETFNRMLSKVIFEINLNNFNLTNELFFNLIFLHTQKTVCLQHLILKNSDLSDRSCIVIYRALRKGSHLISLNLENSNIQGRSFPGLGKIIEFINETKNLKFTIL